MGENWEFVGPDGPTTARVVPCMRSNSGDTCRLTALAGHGLVLEPSFLVGAEVRSGRLVAVLPEYRSIELGVYAVYPTRKFMPAKVRLLIDFLVEAFRAPTWPE